MLSACRHRSATMCSPTLADRPCRPLLVNFFGWFLIGLIVAAVLPAWADTCSYTYSCGGSSQCASLMGGYSGTKSDSGPSVNMDMCERGRMASIPGGSSHCVCTSGNSSSASTGGAMISNTGNFKQDTLTNAVNLMIVSNTKNPIMSSFMQGAATGFISSMFANNAEAQRQQQLMAQAILQRRQEQERQRRIAEQQRLDAMFARLNSALKLEGVPFNLSLKGMSSSSPESLQLKGMGSSGPDDLKLKIADSTPTSYGLKGLPGMYVGGPAGGDSASSNASGGAANQNPAVAAANPNLVSGPGTGTTGLGIPGLPGIYLDGVQPSQAPQLAQAAQTLKGPERDAAQDAALQAAQKNPTLAAPSEDPKVQNFQQSSQEYQQALADNNTASQDYQTAQTHVESDRSAIEVARTQLNAIAPSVEQQKAFDQMLAAAKTDEEASMLARQNFDSTAVHLSASRDRAAATLASLSPASTPSSSAPAAGLNPNAFVANLKTPDRSGTPVSLTLPVSVTQPGPTERQYRPSGNGLVGGTGWIVGYNVPNPTPELIAKSRAMLAEQERLAGHPYSDAIDFQHYNFVIGIAAYADFSYDLLARVVSRDEFTAGRYSIENMPGYAALTGRSFHELACHSNGAMVCLAALERKDVKADNVVLYGPQITEKALEEWDALVRSGQVKSVTLVFNSGDPVPPLSLGFEDYVRSRVEFRPESYGNKALLKTEDLTSAINQTAPRLLVHVYDCPFSLSDPLHCHGMDTYRSEGAH